MTEPVAGSLRVTSAPFGTSESAVARKSAAWFVASASTFFAFGWSISTYEPTLIAPAASRPLKVGLATTPAGVSESAPAECVNGLVLHDLRTGATVERVQISKVHLRPMADDVIKAFAAEPLLLTCAGALMIEHPSVKVRQLEGGYHDSPTPHNHLNRGIVLSSVVVCG